MEFIIMALCMLIAPMLAAIVWIACERDKVSVETSIIWLLKQFLFTWLEEYMHPDPQMLVTYIDNNEGRLIGFLFVMAIAVVVHPYLKGVPFWKFIRKCIASPFHMTHAWIHDEQYGNVESDDDDDDFDDGGFDEDSGDLLHPYNKQYKKTPKSIKSLNELKAMTSKIGQNEEYLVKHHQTIWTDIDSHFGSFKNSWNACKDVIKACFRIKPIGWGICLVILLDIFSFGISINSKYRTKQASRSIPVRTISSKQAPEYNKHKTPVAVAPEYAFYKVNNAFGKVPNNNAYEIAKNPQGHDEIQAQYWHNEPVYIIPLQFRGWRQWLNYKTIPGYFVVPATKTDPTPIFVHKTIKYSDSFYFNHNIDRRIFESHNSSVEMGQNSQLVINKHGTPFYTETMFKPSLFNVRPNYHHLQVAVANAQNGKYKTYQDLSEVPSFIKESISSDVASRMFNTYGHDYYGYWQTHHIFWFGGAERGVKNPTGEGPEDGVTTVFGKHQSIDYMSDFTSTSRPTSAIGIGYINSHTGRLTYYKVDNINDASQAKDNANRNVSYKGWTSSTPVPYTIKGTPTWIMSVIDQDGLTRRYYCVNGENNSVYGSGKTINSALSDYLNEITTGSHRIHNSKKSKLHHHTGIIDRCNVGQNRSFFTLKGSKQIYSVSSSKYDEARLLKSGDKVSFTSGMHGINFAATDFVDQNLK